MQCCHLFILYFGKENHCRMLIHQYSLTANTQNIWKKFSIITLITFPSVIKSTRYSTASFIRRFFVLTANKELILSNAVLPPSCDMLYWMLDAQLCLQLQFVHRRTRSPNYINSFNDLGPYFPMTVKARVQLKSLTRQYVQTSPTYFNPGWFARTCQTPVTEVQIEDLCDLTSCWLGNSYRCFDLAYCLHLQRQCILQSCWLVSS